MDIIFLGFFILVISFLLLLDLFLFDKFNNSSRNIILISLFYFIIAILFGSIIFINDKKLGVEFFTGYLTEKTLSIDNLFVIKIIFDHFKIPESKEHRILFIGIITAIILRGLMIFLSSRLLHTFTWVLDVFAIVLILTAIKLAIGINSKKKSSYENYLNFFNSKNFSNNSEKFFVQSNGKLKPTSLFMALICIEIMDLIFAIDSIPAIFAITQNTMIVYTSNIFAILGLRSLYSLIKMMSTKFYYIKHAMILILLFIGIKIILGKYFFIDPLISLSIIIAILSISIAYSYKKIL
jgi:tellurite resistance protein TerC